MGPRNTAPSVMSESRRRVARKELLLEHEFVRSPRHGSKERHMGRERSADEVQAFHQEMLGPKLGPVFHALWNEWAWLRVKWGEYLKLFGTSPERVELLSSAAGRFFRMLQDTLWEDTLLHLSRLTDRQHSAGRSNLTIRALPKLCDDPELRAGVARLVETAVGATEFARDWRNRHVGHRDLELALGGSVRPLADASRAHVAEALSAIHAVLNRISESMLERTLADHVIVPETGALTLMHVIRDGLDTREAREQRIRSGIPQPGDLGPRML